ncbi:MAG: TonB-dependent receptor [Bernardetiaceae bacterium]|jgi:TonB-linked SusC/RagA family outer membrane protein|nr:TonB-dependent receptor [Bernardetiaceae bacterium]
MKKVLQLGWMLFFSILSAHAQDRQISGTVTDGAEKTALPGVNIVVKGTTTGTTTDADGKYRLSVPRSATTLTFSYVGFLSQDVAIDNRSTIDVALMPDATTIDEVVVTGYGNFEKRQVAGSAAVVSSAQIQSVPLASFDQALQGQAPGLLIQANSGQPGAAASVVIRGRGSITGSTNPLYILDGVAITAENFATLNPQDFASLTVLKDAASTSIYGSRGANGVIVITTKQGKAGKTRFDYSGQYGLAYFPPNPLQLMNTNEKIDYELRRGGTPLEDFSAAEIAQLRTIETDWQKEIFQVGRTHNHQLSASGGNEKTTFYVSGNLFQQTGTVQFTGLDRYTGRANIQHDAGNLRLGLNAQMGFSKYTNTTEGNAGIASPLNAIRWANPYETPFDANGNYTNILSGQPNPVQEMLESNRQIDELKGVGNVFAEYTLPFLKELSVRTSWGVDYENQDRTTYFSRFSFVGQGAGARRNGSLARDANHNTRWTGTTSINYNKTFGDHSLNLGLFQELVRNQFRSIGYTGYGLTGNLQNEAGITPGSPTNNFIPDLRGNGTINALISYFFSGVYGYKDRYFLSLGARRDGSSRFGVDRRYANFWSVGASWIMSDESFMSGIDKSILGQLKLKASYGTVGNQFGIGDFASRELYSPVSVTAANLSPVATVAPIYDGRAGLLLRQLANPNLTWETRATFNAGVEFNLFNDRITGGIEFYNSVTSNLFLDVQLSRVTGYQSLLSNAGKIRNRGLEIQLNTTPIQADDFKWTLGGNFTVNRNQVLELTPTTPEIGIVNGLVVNRIGQPINGNFLVEYVGVDPQTGASQYRNLNGEVTTTYSPNDRQIFGTRDAPFFGGITNSLSFKGLELSFLLNYVLGSKVYNNDRTNVEDPTYYADNVSRDLVREWQRPGDITDIPNPDQEMQRGTTRFLEDGSFWRLRNVMLSYTLPASVVSKAKLSMVRVFVQGQNALTWTKFRGFDPELAQGTLVGAQYPALRQVTFGLNIGF